MKTSLLPTSATSKRELIYLSLCPVTWLPQLTSCLSLLPSLRRRSLSSRSPSPQCHHLRLLKLPVPHASGCLALLLAQGFVLINLATHLKHQKLCLSLSSRPRLPFAEASSPL